MFFNNNKKKLRQGLLFIEYLEQRCKEMYKTSKELYKFKELYRELYNLQEESISFLGIESLKKYKNCILRMRLDKKIFL